MTVATLKHWTEIGVGKYRLCREPAEGQIVKREEGPEGLEIVLYETTSGYCEWRILEPTEVYPIDHVSITRAEGPSHLCGKELVCRSEMRPPMLPSDNGKPWRCSALIVAGGHLFHWGSNAPTQGNGYDKCDFNVEWTNGLQYGGRFDLQRGGTDDGENFGDSLRGRLRFYSGLSPTLHHFTRKNAIDRYTDEEARERYLEIVNSSPEFRDNCIQILATCEL